MKAVSSSTSLMADFLSNGGSETSRSTPETFITYITNSTIFPLRLSSKDHLHLLNQIDEAKENAQTISGDDRLYFEILSAVSSPGKSLNGQNFGRNSAEIVNKLDKTQGAAPLHYACINGNLPMVKHLVESKADINIWDANKKVTPLMCAAAYGRLEVVQFLISQHCDVNAGLNNRQYTALSWAVRRNHPEVVRCLLENNAHQNSIVPYSETPSHVAVMFGLPEILKLLIRARAQNHKSDFQMGPEKNSPLHLAASGEFENSFELCKILLEEGNVYVNSVNAMERTPLHVAAASHDVEIVNLLISHRAKINEPDIDGRTPIFYTISDEDDDDALDCMNALLHGGRCNVNYQDKLGNTPLHLAGLKGAAAAAEILLMNNADFSIRAEGGLGGVSALSALTKKIPSTAELLTKVFDQAVTLTNDRVSESKASKGDMVEVNFKYILPSATPSTSSASSEPRRSKSLRKSLGLSRMTALFKDEEDDQEMSTTRKETAKIKCLVDEEYSNLLLHPVIHSFLELKWHTARFIYLPTLTFKLLLVLLFSTYINIPFVLKEHDTFKMFQVNMTDSSINDTNTKTIAQGPINDTPPWFQELKWMYYVIVAMATLKGLGELVQVLHAPKRQLKTLHPWIAFCVLWIMIFYMKPCTCKDVEVDNFRRSMAALGVLLAWIDIWVEMGRFPRIGLSIRVFLQVLKNFSLFILPHFCLLAGFMLSFSVLFPKNPEFQSILLVIPKLTRIMAGDITISDEGKLPLTPQNSNREIFAQLFLVYIYTSYILIVAIVLGNLLIGLAVNDIHAIYAEASAEKLVNQTILLNTLETSISGNWTRFCIPKGILSRYINLFPKDSSARSKIISFNPNDSSSSVNLSKEQKKDLLSIGNVNREVSLSKQRKDSSGGLLKLKRLSRFAGSKKWSKAGFGDDEQRMLMENINMLVVSFLEQRRSSKP